MPLAAGSSMSRKHDVGTALADLCQSGAAVAALADDLDLAVARQEVAHRFASERLVVDHEDGQWSHGWLSHRRGGGRQADAADDAEVAAGSTTSATAPPWGPRSRTMRARSP